jgi:hypothetical protein
MLQLATLRALKGAPLSVYMALILAQTNLSEKYLCTITGYSKNSVRSGCDYLMAAGLVSRPSRFSGYCLTGKELQNPLIIEGQNLTLGPTTTTLNKKEQRNSEEAAERRSKNDPRWLLLRKYGIYDPTASELLELEWMTEEYIKAHGERAQKKNKPIGLLIHILRSNDPAPKEKSEREKIDEYKRSWLGN